MLLINEFIVDMNFTRGFTVSFRKFVYGYVLNQFQAHFPRKFFHVDIILNAPNEFVHVCFFFLALESLAFPISTTSSGS